jgi:hypothetical protein
VATNGERVVTGVPGKSEAYVWKVASAGTGVGEGEWRLWEKGESGYPELLKGERGVKYGEVASLGEGRVLIVSRSRDLKEWERVYQLEGNEVDVLLESVSVSTSDGETRAVDENGASGPVFYRVEVSE